MDDETQVTEVWRSANGLWAMVVNDGDDGIFVFHAGYEGLKEVSALEGEWERVWSA